MIQEKITQFNELTAEKAELTVELKRIDGFLARPADNKDNARAINKGKIFVKFAGTACMLPAGIFNGALNSRRAEINQRLTDIESEINAL